MFDGLLDRISRRSPRRSEPKAESWTTTSAEDLRREAMFQEFIAERVSDVRQKNVLLGRAGRLRKHADFLEHPSWNPAPARPESSRPN
jgi:hypothetical protein